MTDATERIEWATMTDKQKCSLVAKKLMGWTTTRPEGARSRLWVTDEGLIALITPDYLNDPAAWWPIVESMENPMISKVWGNDYIWWQITVDHEDKFVGMSQSMGEAVCLAALKSAGYEVVE